MKVPGQNGEVIDWLLAGDVSIQYQTCRDLLGIERPELRARIATEGWGKQYLDRRNPDGSWGKAFYQPKWTSSHYTLLEMKRLSMPAEHPLIRASIQEIFRRYKSRDGGIGTSPGLRKSDVCVNGMFLNYASYFGAAQNDLNSIVDFLLDERMEDGGFNCRSNRSGAHHSSLHSTLSVLEGILEYEINGYRYRLDELQQAACRSREFILQHRFFRSDRTGQIINRDFLTLSHPPRWRYNILKALDYFHKAKRPFDARMQDAIDLLLEKRRKDGRWPQRAALPGKVFFVMEPPRGPSRWNTLMVLGVLNAYGGDR